MPIQNQSHKTDATKAAKLSAIFADVIEPDPLGGTLNAQTLDRLLTWSATPAEAIQRVTAIQRAKTDAELEYDAYIMYEDLQREISAVINQVISRWPKPNASQSKWAINASTGDLYASVKAVFDKAAHQYAFDNAGTAKVARIVMMEQAAFNNPINGKQARAAARMRNAPGRAARAKHMRIPEDVYPNFDPWHTQPDLLKQIDLHNFYTNDERQ